MFFLASMNLDNRLHGITFLANGWEEAIDFCRATGWDLDGILVEARYPDNLRDKVVKALNASYERMAA